MGFHTFGDRSSFSVNPRSPDPVRNLADLGHQRQQKYEIKKLFEIFMRYNFKNLSLFEVKSSGSDFMAKNRIRNPV